MNFKQKFTAILAMLGFADKAKTNELTDADWTRIEQSYKEKYGSDMQSDYAESSTQNLSNEERTQILAILGSAQNINENSDSETESSDNSGSENGDNNQGNNPQNNTDIVAAVKALADSNKDLIAQMTLMASQSREDNPPMTSAQTITPFMGPGNNEKFLFGIDHPMFNMSDRHNKVASNPAYAALNKSNEEDEKKFFSDVKSFSSIVRNRYDFLKSNNMLDPVRLAAGDFTLGTTNLSNAGLGNQFVVRRVDALIARILAVRTVTDLFPIRYGIQDRDLITNAFFDSVSQAWQGGQVFKGSMELKPEMGYVDDVMFKTRFGTMEEIERLYIGYLNKEGSDAMKWSMIEFALVNMYTVLTNEQNKRRIMGCYMTPESNKPGHYLNAATGVLYTLVRLFHQNSLLPCDSAEYSSYTSTDMYDAVSEFVTDVMSSLDEDQDLGNKVLYLNLNHRPWWIKNIRTVFGKDTDFNGPQGYANVMPDTNLQIKWIPNLGQLPLMLIQEPGNIQLLENVAGEMLSVKLQTLMEEVLAWSRWKEGCSPAFCGKPFASLSALKANNYSLQQIFMNKPCKTLAANATTIDGKAGFWFVTSANTGETAPAITEISNIVVGKVYIIECGSATKASTIAKSGNFANITAAWTPTAVGDYIMVGKHLNGNLVELERCVGGTRTINTTVQPNIIGGRK